MTARNVGGTTDRNSLSTRQANCAAVLVEEQPQKLAVNAPRCRHARRQERQRPIARIWLPVAANLVSSGLVKELVGPIRVAQRAVALHITRISDEVVAHGDIDHQIMRAHKASTHRGGGGGGGGGGRFIQS